MCKMTLSKTVWGVIGRLVIIGLCWLVFHSFGCKAGDRLKGWDATPKQIDGTNIEMPTVIAPSQAGGINTVFTSALPAGVLLILILVITLSHRREVIRLKANGKPNAEANRIAGILRKLDQTK